MPLAEELSEVGQVPAFSIERGVPSVSLSTPSRPFRAVWAVALAGTILSVVLAAWFWREAQRLDQARFDQAVYRLTEDLDTHTEKIEAMLRDLARVLAARAEPSLLDWDEFMNQISPSWNFPGIAGIGYATNHGTAGRLEFMTPWLLQSAADRRWDFFAPHPFLMQTQYWSWWVVEVYRASLQPAGRFTRTDRSTHLTGDFHRNQFQELIDPFTLRGRTAFFGINRESTNRLPQKTIQYLHSSAPSVQDVAARDSVEVVRYDRLWQDHEGRPFPDITMLVPVAHPRRRESWQKLAPRSGSEEQWLRWQLNNGLILACLDFDVIVSEIQGKAPPEVALEIYATTNLISENRVSLAPELSTGKISESAIDSTATNAEDIAPGFFRVSGGKALRGSDRSRLPDSSSFSRRQPWSLYGDACQLHFRTTHIFDQRSTRYRSWSAAGLGLLITASVCWALALQTRGRLLEVQRSTELQEARDALQAAQQQRERLSHDLHDGAIQSLYAIQLGLTRVGREMEAMAPATAVKLADSRVNLDAVIGELREFIVEMEREETRRPTTELAAALESLVRRLRPASSTRIDLHCDAAASSRLRPAQSIELATITREAISNSLRHANAQNIRVALTAENSFINLEIADDGLGFDAGHKGGAGFGLGTMKARAQKLGADFKLDTLSGQGTTIRVRLPTPHLRPE